MMEATTPTLARYWQGRLLRLRRQMAEAGVDGLYIVDSDLLSWLGYFHAEEALVTEDSVLTTSTEEIFSFMKSVSAIGVDRRLQAGHLLSLQKRVPHVTWKPLGEAIARLFVVKDLAELVLLRQAAQITRQVFERLEICEGRSELDLLYQAHRAMLDLGGSGFSFDPSIAGGIRTALPWAGVSSNLLQHGEAVLVDLGISFRGYQSDMARSYLVGASPSNKSEEWQRAMSAVEEALACVRSQALPGARCDSLHLLGTRILEEAGFGPMRHALGHGIGMQVHERPYLSPGCTDVLEVGMVIALEPGVILSTGEGIRYEEVIVVTEQGGEFLA